MPVIKISVPHDLGADEAKHRIVNLVSEAKGNFGKSVSDVKESWIDNRGEFSFRAMGFSVSGNLQVEPKSVDLEITLPFAALPFKSRIEGELSSKAKALLA